MSHLACFALVAGALAETSAMAGEFLGPECIVDRYLVAQEATSSAVSREQAFEKLGDLFTADAQYIHAAAGAEISGRENIIAGFRHFAGNSRNTRYEVHDFFSNANAVSISLTRHFDRRANDRWVRDSAHQMMVFELDGEHIKTIRDYWVAENTVR